MKKISIILISFIVSNCSFKPVVKHHGVPFLEKKQLELTVDESNKKVAYKIVGEDEADLKKGKLSVTSPISRSLVGKSEGDIVTIKTPSGNIEYEILEVKYV